MKLSKVLATACLAAVGTVGLVSFATAEPAKGAAPAGAPEMQLPPGWTKEDMQACMDAAVPGKMHEWLAKGVGTWEGKNTMWMFAGAPPMESKSTCTITSTMDGKFFRVEHNGEMPGMGPFNGFGLYGYDNVSQKFVGTWIDNMGTGMMQGTGELASDGTTLNWTYTYNCPINKKPTTMREVEKITGPNTRTLEMFMPDPKTGVEYQMLKIEFTKK
jgi:Protein of unknown function (DUF1579)